MRVKPTWNDYLIGLAKVATARSSDEQTQHGCVLAGEDHQVISTGCNGHCRGLKDDSVIPTTRPEKYPWMIHAESNALANANGPVKGTTAYVTGASCFGCMQLLWQNGVRKIVQVDGYGWQADEKEQPLKELFLEQSGMEVQNVKPDLSWLVDLVLNDPQLNAVLMEKLGGMLTSSLSS